jgi:sialate O-acetylesterase
MPFYFVQITSFKTSGENSIPEPREAQLAGLRLANTAMAVTLDIGDIGDVHARNKQDVGKRLGLIALNKTYNVTGIVCDSPMYRAMKVEGDKIRLFFDHAKSGLICSEEKLENFTIGVSNNVFFEAEAHIDGCTILVSSPKVEHPVAARYCWSNTAIGTLFNCMIRLSWLFMMHSCIIHFTKRG